MLRVVKDVSNKVCVDRELGHNVRFRTETASVIHNAAEQFLTNQFEGAVIAARHAGRVTVDDRDIRVVHEILLSQGMPNLFEELNRFQRMRLGPSRNKVTLPHDPPEQGSLVENDLWDTIQDPVLGPADDRVIEIE